MVSDRRSHIQSMYREHPESWRWPILVWVGATFILWAWWFALINTGVIDVSTFLHSADGWLQTWNRNDSAFYRVIAEEGYITAETSLFYPVYPILGRWISVILRLPEFSGLILLSHLATLGILLLLYQLALEWRGASFAQRVVLVAAFFPTSFYFWSPYPHSLLLFFVLLAHFFARRGWWLAACFPGLLAGATHSTGVIAVLPLAILGFQAARRSSGILRWILLVPAIFPIFGFGLFQAWRLFAGFDSYGFVQYVFFRRVFYWPWVTLGKAVYEAFSPDTVQMMPRINFALLIFLFLAIFWSVRHFPLEHTSYLVGGLAIVLTASSQTEALWNLARLLLAMFPIFFVLADWSRNRTNRRVIAGFMLTGWVFLSAIFLSGFWVG